MSKKNKPSRKHHFVPQAQLRHFSTDDKHKYLYSLDKQTDASFQISIKNAGSQNDYNSVFIDGKKHNFEHLFQDVDDRSAELVARILKEKSLGWMAKSDRTALADFIAAQLVRTKFSRTEPKKLAHSLRQMMREVGFDPDDNPDMAMPSDARIKISTLTAFLERDGHSNAILRLVPSLYEAEDTQYFLTSDHPVVRANAFPYGDSGIASPGIQMYVPLSPRYLLALHCPSIVARYEMIDKLELPDDRHKRMTGFRDGIRSGTPIEVDQQTVAFLNSLQVRQSSNYLYSKVDDFDFARKLLDRQPDLRSVASHIEVGEMGMAPPARNRMPQGWQLVVFGSVDHCSLTIDELDEQGEGITAATSQTNLLTQIVADKGPMRVELYQDGNPRRGMSQVMFELIAADRPSWFRVVHRDPGLRSLGASIDRNDRPDQNLKDSTKKLSEN